MIDLPQHSTISHDQVALSIAVPTYNRAHSITTLVESILDQSDSVDEIIVSDDGSRDNTSESLRSLKGRFRILQQATNRGMVTNWNTCLNSATKDWICILHDDDRLEPGGLAALRTACSLVGEPAVILHQYKGDEFGGAFRCTISAACPWNALNCPTIPSGVVVHKSIIKSMGVFDIRFKYSADLEFFPRIAARFPLVVIESPRVVTFRLHGNNYEFNAWRNPDCYVQLEEIQRTIIRHAGIEEDGVANNLLQIRMEANLRYMLDLAAYFGDASLVRYIAAQCRRYRSRLSLKRRVMLHIAALTGMRLGLRRDCLQELTERGTN
jgi:glycosyltransferase involved in cell wall biosynthesis